MMSLDSVLPVPREELSVRVVLVSLHLLLGISIEDWNVY
jgi:hypothetical protein